MQSLKCWKSLKVILMTSVMVLMVSTSFARKSSLAMARQLAGVVWLVRFVVNLFPLIWNRCISLYYTQV